MHAMFHATQMTNAGIHMYMNKHILEQSRVSYTLSHADIHESIHVKTRYPHAAFPPQGDECMLMSTRAHAPSVRDGHLCDARYEVIIQQPQRAVRS